MRIRDVHCPCVLPYIIPYFPYTRFITQRRPAENIVPVALGNVVPFLSFIHESYEPKENGVTFCRAPLRIHSSGMVIKRARKVDNQRSTERQSSTSLRHTFIERVDFRRVNDFSLIVKNKKALRHALKDCFQLFNLRDYVLVLFL